MSYRPGVPILAFYGAVVGFGILGALIGGRLGYYIAFAPVCIGIGGVFGRLVWPERFPEFDDRRWAISWLVYAAWGLLLLFGSGLVVGWLLRWLR
jgi:hypothetical protein